MQNAPTKQAPSLYRLKVGDALVTVLGDGTVQPGSWDVLKGIDAAEAERIETGQFRLSPPVFSLSCFLINTDGKVIMVDTGGGRNVPTAGLLPGALNAAGVSPDAVDLVLLTHLHPDHVGGLVTEDGRAVFPNAAVALHEAEAEFWLDTADPPEAMKTYFDAARTALAPYRERTSRFAKGTVAPGIEAEPLPGHTPGHTGFHLTSGKERLFIWADVVHAPAIQSRHPEVYLGFDADPEQAKAQRARVFDMVAADRLLVAGHHLDFPTFSHLERRSGGGYAFVPIVWRAEL